MAETIYYVDAFQTTDFDDGIKLGDFKLVVTDRSGNKAEYTGEDLSNYEININLNTEDKSATAIVPDSQLSLAIGREGQNVRLAAKLTSWKIDIKSEAQIRASVEEELFGEGECEMVEAEGVDEAINPYDENGEFDPNLV